MKKIYILLFLLSPFLRAQTIYKTIESTNLNQKRELKIWIPPNYEENKNKTYPIILVLDGDYLFEPVAGNVSYFSYQDKMPEAIVVGVKQAKYFPKDTFNNEQTSFYTTESTAFYDFLKDEVLRYIRDNYRTTDFEVIVGHGRTANFINYFLFDDLDLFEAYIVLSPALAMDMREKIVDALSSVKNNLWYYSATASDDFILIKKDAQFLKTELSSMHNKNFHTYFDNFEGKNHYTLVAYAIPAALEKIFFPYGPILKKEYEKMLAEEENYCDYLLGKYKNIEDLYNLDQTIRTNDFMAVAAAIKKSKKWKEYSKLSEIAEKNYPETMLGNYFEALFYEGTGRPREALVSYKKAYPRKEIAFLTKDFIWKRINRLNEYLEK